LQLDLIAEPRDLSLTKREAEIAVRLARPNREMRTWTQRIGYLEYAVYSAIERNADNLPRMSYDDMMADLPQAKWIGEQIKADGSDAPLVRVNDAETLVRVVEEGLGKSLLPMAVGDALSSLVCAHIPTPPLRREVWLLLHPELSGLSRVRVVADWISRTVAELPQRTD
jgi:DNA-binding transcriptional LysR family regulator